MGREARLKQARRAQMKSEAWQQGIPTVVQLSEESYARLQTAMENSAKAEAVIVQVRTAAQKLRHDAMQAAGLDPRHTYRLNAEKFTAELAG